MERQEVLELILSKNAAVDNAFNVITALTGGESAVSIAGRLKMQRSQVYQIKSKYLDDVAV